jgi:uncharacterized membrane protein YuzA (DUF378 family)
MNIVRLQDNKIVAQISLLLLSLASINYLFVAFGKNPLQALLCHKTIQFIVYILIGIAGIQFFFKSFNVVQIFPRLGSIGQRGIDLATSAVGKAKQEIQTLENYRRKTVNKK